jgi:hypothetical protein
MPVSWIYSSINAGQETEVILILASTKSHIVGNNLCVVVCDLCVIIQPITHNFFISPNR